MLELPETIQEAVNQFGKIPGIGPKSALRHVLHIIASEKRSLEEFGNAVLELSQIKHCSKCGMLSDEEVCAICLDPRRAETSVLCVVENVSDLMAIEKSGKFDGLYHVLGGVLNPLLGIGPVELNMESLFQRLKGPQLKEVILAINPSVEGDATCAFINQQLPETTSVDRIGFGVPIGGNLEYLDPMTISKALENRRPLM